MSANSHITARQAAKLMNVSVTSFYEARRLEATGRSDLCDQVRAGTLSLNAALVMAGAKSRRTRLDTLKSAWNGASSKEREAFMEWLEHER